MTEVVVVERVAWRKSVTVDDEMTGLIEGDKEVYLYLEIVRRELR